ncbi:hypothetical protein V8C42DRAFT_329848 [Trichoderma barbatum]
MDLLRNLYSDDDLCRTFGFNSCFDESDVAELLCLYNSLLRSFKLADLQLIADYQLLGGFIYTAIMRDDIKHYNSVRDCNCFHWFQNPRLEDFEIPSPEGLVAYQ